MPDDVKLETPNPTQTPEASVVPVKTPEPVQTPEASAAPVETPNLTQTPKPAESIQSSASPSKKTGTGSRTKKKSGRPVISIQKKGGKKLRYVQITVKSSGGRYFDLYMKRRGKKYVRIRLAKNSLKKGKRVVKLVYVQKGYTLWFKVRTYDKINGKKKYRAYSGQKKIRL